MPHTEKMFFIISSVTFLLSPLTIIEFIFDFESEVDGIKFSKINKVLNILLGACNAWCYELRYKHNFVMWAIL